MNGIMTVLIAIIVFLFIIMVHEFGHFITAKMFHVKVPEFAIGFGPAIFKRQKGETLYSLRAFPIGGYVRMEGEDENSDDVNALCNKPIWQRIIIVAAGAFLNILMGFIIYAIVYAQMPQMPILTVQSVYENTPAFEYLMPGDKITAVNGNKVWYYKDFKFLINTIDAGKEIKLTVKRGDEKLNINITPQYDKQSKSYILGFQMKQENMTWWRVLKYGVCETFFIIRVILYSLFMLFTGKVAITSVSGPVGTVGIMSKAASNGFYSFIQLFAMLTVNVGVFNLLPIPALDGGRVFFMFVELLRGKPIDPQKEGVVHFAGLVLLLAFMLFITVNDITTLIKR
ncbi:MAG: M50 family metallopeptidase [Bacillota bacterium]|nr:M50 family metallopeptidase [Bacillota bacterium]